MSQINFKNPRYALPLILLPVFLLIGYATIDMFSSSNDGIAMEDTDEINTKLPEANLDNRKNLGKFEALKDAFKKSSDFSSIQSFEKDEPISEVIDSGSLYTDEEMRIIDSINLATRLKEKDFNAIGDYSLGQADTDITREAPGKSKMQEEMELFKMQMAYLDSIQNPKPAPAPIYEEMKVTPDPNIGALIKDESPSQQYFNTIGSTAKPKTIMAILDEDIKVVEGSRIRIRLLDDVKLKDRKISKGSYLYGNVSGFSNQRVLIQISSIHIDGKHYKVDLSIYDNDGQEGFYVPSSSFRDLSKEIGGRMGNQNIQFDQQAQGIEQFAFGALQDAYKSTSQAISRNIKTNRAKLKYNSHIYLVNNQEKEEL